MPSVTRRTLIRGWGMLPVAGLTLVVSVEAFGAQPSRLVPGATARVTRETELLGAPAPNAVGRTLLATGTLVTLTGDPVEASRVLWWPVTVMETGREGWVDAAALEPVATETAVASREPVSEFAGQPNLTEAQLFTLLPGQDVVPKILTVVTDVSRTEDEVAAALGGNRLAETNLATWGWSANVERQFTPPEPVEVEQNATSFVSVSLHGFGSVDACAEALVFFSDIVAEAGWEDIEPPSLGDSARMLSQTAVDGATTVALYVQDGAVLYRFGGSSATGDPANDMIDIATAILH